MTRGHARIEALDALRGFAIFGILLINIQVFSGYGFVGLEGRAALPWSGRDEQLDTLLDVLVRGKFYSLFALLFGYSFVMLARKAGDGAAGLHLHRMAGLLVIGLAHSILLWPWDILVLYALVGVLLTPFLHRSAVTLAVWGIALLATVAVLNGFGPAIGLPEGRGAFATRVLQENVSALAGGSYPEVLRANLNLTVSIFVEWVQGLRPLRVLGLFLLGAAGAALRLAERDSGHRPLLGIIAVLGLAAGLALSMMQHLAAPDTDLMPVIEWVADAAGAPLLAIGYAATLTFWWHGRIWITRAVRAALAPVGRMALTNYLLQSVVCVPLFYGFGAGWFAEVSLGLQLLFCAGLFIAQMIFSTLWLSVFTQGPMEWLWRWQIKRKRPPFFKSAGRTSRSARSESRPRRAR